MCLGKSDLRIILHPVLCLSKIVGLSVFNLETRDRSAFWTYYSSMVIFLYLFQYSVNGIFIIRLFAADRKDGVSKGMSLATSSITEMLTTASALLINFKQYDKKMKIILRLFEIEKDLMEIGIKVRFSKSKWYSNILLSVVNLLCCFTVDFTQLTVVGRSAFTISILSLRCTAMVIGWINMGYFMAVLKIVREYFKCINDDLVNNAKLLERKLWFSRRFGYRIEIITRTHNSLRKICKWHSALNEFPLTFLCMFFTSVITTMMYFLLMKYISKLEYPNEESNIKADYFYFVYWIVTYYSFCYTFLNSIVHTVREVRVHILCLLCSILVELDKFD